MGDFRCAFSLKAIDGYLQRRIGFCHTLMLPQMFQPGIDEKGLNKSTVIHRILEYPPVIRAVAAAPHANSAIAFRNASRCAGSMSYSVVTSTGPRSRSIS